jgi:UDP-GlcNAc:undecaprenyl-phosphate GlcNAc-1-phosphate transferase
MSILFLLVPAAAAGLLTYLLTPLAGWLALRLGAVDKPGPRKIHQRPIPRLGGVAVVASGVIVALIVRWLLPATLPRAPIEVLVGVALGLVPIVVVSILDDIRPLPPGPKAVAHLAGALIAVYFGISLHGQIHLFGHTIAIGWLAVPLSIVWLMGTTNAFNIVDGLDGLAAGLGFISACGLCAVFLLVHEDATARYALLLAGAIAGFLPYNIFPARMFFGDTGATAIGFCLGAFALRGGATLSAGFAAILPIVVLGMPIAETLISMLRRAVRRLEKNGGGIFQADSNHIHHRLLALGIDHPRAVLLLYGAGAVLGGLALLSTLLSAGESALLVVGLLLAAILGVQRLGYDEFAIIRNGTVLRAYDAPVLNRSMFAVFLDAVIVVVASAAAVALKTDGNLLGNRVQIFGMIAALAPVTIVVFWRMGLYRGTWRLAGADDFVRASGGVVIASLLGMTVRLLLTLSYPPVTLFAIYALVAVVLVTGSRASYQILAASRWRFGKTGATALIYGAGRKGAMALRELQSNPSAEFRPVGFIDDDAAKTGTFVSGLPVLGTMRTIEGLMRRHGVRTVIVATDTVPDPQMAQLGDRCERAGVSLLKISISLDAVGAVGAAERAAERVPAVPALAALATHAAPTIRFEDARIVPVPPIASERCPTCGSIHLHRSHVRKITERVRKRLTDKRLFRCDECGWRGWNLIIDSAAYASFAVAGGAAARERAN